MQKLIFITMLILPIVCQNNNLLAAAKTGSAAAAAAGAISSAPTEAVGAGPGGAAAGATTVAQLLHSPAEIAAATQKLFSILKSNTPTVEKIDKVLKNGADVNGCECNEFSHTPLTYAILLTYFFHPRYIEIIKLLLDNGADVNKARSWRGNTPLIEAALPLIYTNQPQIIKLLLDNGANVNIPDDYGETFLSHINRSYMQEAKEVYEKYEKSVESDQKQVIYQMSRVDALRIFPPGLLPLIASHLFHINK